MTDLTGLHKAIKLLLFTAASTVLAYMVSYQLRFDFNVQGEVPQFTIWIGLCSLILMRLASYLLYRVHNLTWRYFSLTEFVPLLKAHTISTAAFLATVLILRLPDFPRSIAVFEFFLSLFFNVGAAISIRILFEKGYYPFKADSESSSKKLTLILGAGATGHLLVKTLQSQSNAPYQPVGALDDSKRLMGSLVHGVPVLGAIAKLNDILTRNLSIQAVLLAVPTLSVKRISEIESICKEHEIEFQRLQSFEDIAVQRIGSKTHSFPIETILKRDISVDYPGEVVSSYTGKRVLVTGGAGSIGSEVVRQLSSIGAKEIVIVDNSEYHLFNLERELLLKYPENSFSFFLLDICDKIHLELLFKSYAPEVVIHAAAYKHVPLGESNPYSVFKVNVLGTSNVISLSILYNAESFILLSTDKAVNPVNVMGRTKRIAELLTQEKIQQSKGSTKAAIVRFGNVINSRGSVIPLFTEQINAGGPVTVTHREVERYFMSIQEAVKLMLTAGTLGENGEIFALDMGEKIRILDIAREMLRLAGREDIEIQFTGLRDGEKLTEEVNSDSENLEPTALHKINRIKSEPDSTGSWNLKVLELAEEYSIEDVHRFRERLHNLLS